MNRFDGAKDRVEATLIVAREPGNRRFEGQALCQAGVLHAHKGPFDEARHCLDSGASLLRALHHRDELGLALCSRAEMKYLAGAVDVAQTALVADAHRAGLFVHPFTFRNEKRRLAFDYRGEPQAEYLQVFRLGVDGAFADFPDTAGTARAVLRREAKR